jgi:ribonucleotide reductase alpha subunit
MMSLKIKKRGGDEVSFNPQKIYNRVKRAAKGLNVNSDEIFIKVITSVPTEGFITTKELDKLVYEIAAAYTGSHHDYSRLASSVAISAYHKETDGSFSNTMNTLYGYGTINDKLIETINDYGAENIDAIINHENDYNFDYFAWRSLQEMYLLKTPEGKVIERPQHMYMRVALWVTKSFEQAVEYYTSLSEQRISPATPIMINAGTRTPQLASCVLKYSHGDSREGLLQTFNDISKYSSDAAGIGLCMSNIRSKESRINSSGGYAGGLLKYLKIVNEGLRFFNQQGRRPGSAAIYLEPWHKDILDLLDIKKNTGAEELRARDLFTSVWLPDNFMEAVRDNKDWYLFCPNDIIKAGIKPLQEAYGDEYVENYNKAVELGLGKKVKAQTIWNKIIESQVETGVPYLSSKDNANRKTNHQNIGVIKQSNLCCLTEESILTIERESGNIENLTIKEVVELIESSEQLKVKTQNGFSNILTGALTRKNTEILEIVDEELGVNIRCTPDHLIFTENRGYVRADELMFNDILKTNK